MADTPGRGGMRLDVERLARVPAAMLLAVIVLLALSVVFVALPPRPHLLHVVQKLGHPSVFAVIALCVLALLRRRRAGGPAWRDYPLVLLACAALGAATELAQLITHRDPSVLDVGLDLRGAAAALLLAAAFDHRLYAVRPRAIRGVALALALGASLAIGFPLLTAIAAYAHRDRLFPVVFAPGSERDLYFIERGPQRLELAAADGVSPARLRVRLSGLPYAGIVIEEPVADWRRYLELRVDVGNPTPAPLEFNVRIDDEVRNFEYDDRYNGAFALAPGERREIAIPLATVAAGPRGRALELGRIARVVLFRSGAGGDEFDLYAVRLAGG